MCGAQPCSAEAMLDGIEVEGLEITFHDGENDGRLTSSDTGVPSAGSMLTRAFGRHLGRLRIYSTIDEDGGDDDDTASHNMSNVTLLGREFDEMELDFAIECSAMRANLTVCAGQVAEQQQFMDCTFKCAFMQPRPVLSGATLSRLITRVSPAHVWQVHWQRSAAAARHCLDKADRRHAWHERLLPSVCRR